ncbi:hypothetical protein V2J09_007722 [Rumex salicifolius]
MLGKMIARASSLPLLLISMIFILSIIVVQADEAGGNAEVEDDYIHYNLDFTYGTLSPLGVPEQVILINGQFPGPTINGETNNMMAINVFNKLDEPLLVHWKGIQLRRNSWEDGTAGTMCPIAPGTNYTYRFQLKDQIGTFTYFPTTNLQRGSGGYGLFRVQTREVIPLPYEKPEDDFGVLIGDWYAKDHVALRKILDEGKDSLGKPDGILINGKRGVVGDENEQPQYRICNVGMRNTLNFRIQNHTLKLVEIEGSHVVQNVYETLDIHLGQCFSVLVTADQNATDYYMVVSSRFTKYDLQTTAKIRYLGGQGQASPALPEAPTTWAWSLNQFRTLRWNLTANAARPNPQGSYKYSKFEIERTIKLANTVGNANGKLRYAINGRSHVDTDTPLKLAEWYGVADKVFQYNTIGDTPPPGIDTLENVELGPIVIGAEHRMAVEIIFENHEVGVQYWHLDGYSFFVVAMEVGEWSPEKRKNYNMLDGVSRYSIQVYPKSWAAIMLTFDNAGMWNLRSESPEKTYLGQQMYVSVNVSSNSVDDEHNMPDEQLVCGIVKDLPRPLPKNV